jgi:hypothetical protein
LRYLTKEVVMRGALIIASLVAALSGISSQPVRSETVWEKLEHGADVIRECAGDIRKNCGDVRPGKGRIKACVAAHLADLSQACLTALATPKPEVLSDGDNAKTKHIENSHLLRYIEIFLAAIDPSTGNIIAECYGTYANADIPADKDTAPQAQVAAINLKRVAKRYGVLGASLNGPKLWIPDSFDINVGAVRQFGNILAPWTAQLNLGKKLDVNNATPYQPLTIARKSAITWNKGTQVIVLDDAAGNTWIMKGFQLGLDPKQTYSAFVAAGASNFKKLPPGWKARVVVLREDNHEVPENGVAAILSDEFFNVYDKTGPGMSNSKP